MNQNKINIERKFRPEIEGLRFVAAMLVAIYHIWLNRVSGGVDVFFVISGFLITTSIISTINRTGELRFWPYISKLIKRLYPSVFFILGVVLLLSIFFLPASIMDKTLREVIASMFYYQNWQLAFSSTDYLDASQMKTPVEHFWALSIQGQFYIIWFIIFVFVLYLMNKNNRLNVRRVLNVLLGVIFISSLVYSIYLTKVNQPFAYFITFTRVWEFALGGLLCINLPYMRINKSIATVVGWLGLIGLILTGIMFEVSEMFPGYIALWPMLCAFLIVLSGTQETKFGVKKLLGSKWLVKLGGISFGIYLWHWVLLQFYRYNYTDTPSFIVGILIILISIILSFIMTNKIEKPIRQTKNERVAYRRLGILGTCSILIVVAIISTNYINEYKLKKLVKNEEYIGAMSVFADVNIPEVEPIPSLSQVFDDLPQAHLDGSNQGLKKSDLKVGEYGELENYEATIVLVGSSHSEHWQGALLEAIKDSKIRLLHMTRSGTRFSTGYDDKDKKGIWNNHVLDYLEEADVDLVISHVTAADSEKDTIHQQMIDQLQFVKDEYGIEGLAIRDVPRYEFNVLETLETRGVEETTKLMNQSENQLDEEFWNDFENSNDTLHKIDLTDYFIVEGEFKPIIGNIRIYRDQKHITNTYSETFGPIFKEKIEDILFN